MVDYSNEDVSISAPYMLKLKNGDSHWVWLECLANHPITSEELPGGIGLLQANRGIFCRKDISAYGGALMTASDPNAWNGCGGGAIQMGHSFTASNDAPMITLTDAPDSRGGYNTLWLKQGHDTYTLATQWPWAHLELGCLNTHGYINVGTSVDGINRFITIQGPNSSGQTATLNLIDTCNYITAVFGSNLKIGCYHGIDFYTNNNTSYPVMNLSKTGTFSILNAGTLKASIDSSGNMGISGTLTINGNGVAAANVLPLSNNSGYVGNSSQYYAYMYMNRCYAKNGYTFGCEVSESGQIWERDFQTKAKAEEFLTHELTKERRHITYDLQNKGKIICTCGKSVDNPCPEHIDEWNDLYTINTTKLLEATSFLAFEMNSELAKLQNDNLMLNERVATLETLIREKQTAT
jgi:hypothetical protein